jgi:hypothetical protein
MARGNKMFTGHQAGRRGVAVCSECRRQFSCRTEAMAMSRAEMHMKLHHGMEEVKVTELTVPAASRRSNDPMAHSKATNAKVYTSIIDAHEQGLLE